MSEPQTPPTPPTTQAPVPGPQAPKEKRELSANTTWKCELSPREDKITVGSLQDLHCSGESVPAFNPDKVKIVFEEKKQDYALKVLGKKNLETDYLDLVVTSYKAGKFEKPVFIITDGEKAVKVETLSWKVESLLKSQQEKPVPSKGPFSLSMPWWYWSSILFGIFLVLSIILIKLKKIWDRKKLIEELSTHATALTPFNQFNKDLRSEVKEWQQKELTEKVRKEEEWRRSLLEHIEKYFRQYLMRELLIPTLEWTDSQILSEIKKRHPKIYDEASLEIKKTLREIQQAQKAQSKITFVDCEQLVTMTRNLTEKIYDVKQGYKR